MRCIVASPYPVPYPRYRSLAAAGECTDEVLEDGVSELVDALFPRSFDVLLLLPFLATGDLREDDDEDCFFVGSFESRILSAYSSVP